MTRSVEFFFQAPETAQGETCQTRIYGGDISMSCDSIALSLCMLSQRPCFTLLWCGCNYTIEERENASSQTPLWMDERQPMFFLRKKVRR
jgi:hypothetical protein